MMFDLDIFMILLFGISLSTHGVLWPQAAIFREQFQGFDVEVEQVTELAIEYDGRIDAIEIEVAATEVAVEVVVLDSITGELTDDTLDVEIECT
jgi:hypothetical protein